MLDAKQRAALAASDEAFWRRQERRRERGMGQPCCTQSGVSWSMIDLPGEIAVVVHGEFDCVNCFHHHIGRSAVRFYSTRLSEGALTRGLTREPLERCLEQIAAEAPPDLVLVLGTCPVEVIGDAFHEVVDEVSARTGVRMVALRTSGLKLTSQREMLDWLYSTLAEACPPAGAPEGLALFGLPGPRRGRPEPVEMLTRAGFPVRACLPRGAHWSDWRGLRGAERTVLVDRDMFPRLVARLEADGQAITEVRQPIGLGPTAALYAALDAALGADGAVLDAVAAEAEAARAVVSAARERLAGRKVGVAIRMLNAYALHALVHQGLGEVPALRELGLEVELLVQGAPDPDARAAFEEALAAQGVGGLPMHIFASPSALPQLLRAQGLDLVSVADSSRHAALEAGVPALDTGALQPYFGGVHDNVRRLRQLLGESTHG